MAKSPTKEQLADLFAQASVRHYDGLLAGDHKKANKEVRVIVDSFRRLKAMGDGGYSALVPLLQHENQVIASSAAAFLLRYATPEATATLKRVSSDKGLVGLQAKESLDRWREGDWHLDE